MTGISKKRLTPLCGIDDVLLNTCIQRIIDRTVQSYPVVDGILESDDGENDDEND